MLSALLYRLFILCVLSAGDVKSLKAAVGEPGAHSHRTAGTGGSDRGQGPETSIMINFPTKLRYKRSNRRDSILRLGFYFKSQKVRR